MWNVIITVGLKLLGFFLDRSAANEKTKQAFLAFVRKAGEDYGSAKLLAASDEQMAFLKKQSEKATKNG